MVEQIGGPEQQPPLQPEPEAEEQKKKKKKFLDYLKETFSRSKEEGEESKPKKRWFSLKKDDVEVEPIPEDTNAEPVEKDPADEFFDLPAHEEGAVSKLGKKLVGVVGNGDENSEGDGQDEVHAVEPNMSVPGDSVSAESDQPQPAVSIDVSTLPVDPQLSPESAPQPSGPDYVRPENAPPVTAGEVPQPEVKDNFWKGFLTGGAVVGLWQRRKRKNLEEEMNRKIEAVKRLNAADAKAAEVQKSQSAVPVETSTIRAPDVNATSAPLNKASPPNTTETAKPAPAAPAQAAEDAPAVASQATPEHRQDPPVSSVETAPAPQPVSPEAATKSPETASNIQPEVKSTEAGPTSEPSIVQPSPEAPIQSSEPQILKPEAKTHEAAEPEAPTISNLEAKVAQTSSSPESPEKPKQVTPETSPPSAESVESKTPAPAKDSSSQGSAAGAPSAPQSTASESVNMAPAPVDNPVEVGFNSAPDNNHDKLKLGLSIAGGIAVVFAIMLLLV